MTKQVKRCLCDLYRSISHVGYGVWLVAVLAASKWWSSCDVPLTISKVLVWTMSSSVTVHICKCVCMHACYILCKFPFVCMVPDV